MLGHVVHMDSLPRDSVGPAGSTIPAAPQLQDFVARKNVDGGEVADGGEEDDVERANTIRARRGRPGALASLESVSRTYENVGRKTA